MASITVSKQSVYYSDKIVDPQSGSIPLSQYESCSKVVAEWIAYAKQRK